MLNEKKNLQGVLAVIAALFLWGVLPLYWKQLEKIPTEQILAHRVLWSFLFVFLILAIRGKIRELLIAFRQGNAWVLFLCGFIISLNWFTYIYAVNTNHIIEASLGYYINPLLTIFLARVVLKEKLDSYQVLAVALAAIGVGIITFSFGSIPLIALVLALTFSAYSLLKKTVQAEVTIGLSLETFAVLPLASAYLIYLAWQDQPLYSALGLADLLLIMGTGIITAIPLMLFSFGAKKVPLTTIGFIQYLSPTISLFLGIFLYKEPFTGIHLVTFVFIWAALFVYSFSQIMLFSSKKKYKQYDSNKHDNF